MRTCSHAPLLFSPLYLSETTWRGAGGEVKKTTQFSEWSFLNTLTERPFSVILSTNTKNGAHLSAVFILLVTNYTTLVESVKFVSAVPGSVETVIR